VKELLESIKRNCGNLSKKKKKLWKMQIDDNTLTL
jgi:hypothetical protein